MTTDLKKLDPKDFGLEESSVATIEQAFQPKIIERDALMSTYEALIVQELTPELCTDAREVRLKLVKVRTGIADIHKTQKAFFLAAGRFVDAWKNKETLPIEQMEEKLSDIEKHFERIEAKRMADLEAARTAQLSEFTDLFPNGLGLLTDASFAIYLSGAKVAYEARIAAEHKQRMELLAVEKAKAEEDAKIRAENERLRKESEDKIVRDKKRNEELRRYIVFIRDYAKMLTISDKEYIKEFSDIKKGAELQWEFDRKELIRIAAEAEAKEKALAVERAEAAAKQKTIEEAAAALVVEREKVAKFEAEKKAEAVAMSRAKAAPDIDKLKKLADDIDKMEMPEISNPATAQILTNVKDLLGKTTKYLREKIKTL